MPPQPAQVPHSPPRPPIPVAPPGAVPPNQPQPPAPEAVSTTNGPENIKAQQVDSPRASTSGAPPPLPSEEKLVVEEAIWLARDRLRRRVAGGSVPPAELAPIKANFS
jgi:receptor expression-enhancing protein 1/2/3/4